MSVYKRKSGRWQVCIDLPPTATGLRHRKKLGTFATRKEAERAERQALEARERGIDLDPEKVTLSELAERFFKAVDPNLAPATIARYEEHWRMHIAPNLGGILAAKLKAAHLSGLYEKLRSEKIRYVKGEKVRFGKPLSANSVLRIHRLLHAMFRWAENEELVQHNVARLVKKAPKATKSPARALTTTQVERVLVAAEGTNLWGFFVVAAETGMRRGEIGALTWDAIDFERGVVGVSQAVGEDRKGGKFIKRPKNDREREIPLSNAATDALRRQRAVQEAEKLAARDGTYNDRGFVFADDKGGLLDLDRVSKSFSAILRDLGIKARGLSLHSLRHFVGTMGLAAGNDVRTISDLLGHADPGLTLRVYGHAEAGARERAVTGISDARLQAKARRLAGEN